MLFVYRIRCREHEHATYRREDQDGQITALDTDTTIPIVSSSPSLPSTRVDGNELNTSRLPLTTTLVDIVV